MWETALRSFNEICLGIKTWVCMKRTFNNTRSNHVWCALWTNITWCVCLCPCQRSIHSLHRWSLTQSQTHTHNIICIGSTDSENFKTFDYLFCCQSMMDCCEVQPLDHLKEKIKCSCIITWWLKVVIPTMSVVRCWSIGANMIGPIPKTNSIASSIKQRNDVVSG